MQRKILWGMAALVLLFVFAGCSQPSDFTFVQKPSTLPSPVVAINAYEGLILLRWQPVVDAKGYDIYRYDTVERVTLKLVTATTQLYYQDWVRWSNQLVDKRNYEYIVVAVSDSNPSYLQGYEGTVAFLNGVQRTSITANIPADLTATFGDADVTIENRFVKIKQTLNLKYSIAQTYGNGEEGNMEIIRRFEKDNLTVPASTWYFPYVTSPLLPIKGKYTVTVKASWGDPSADYTYGKVGEVVKTFDEEVGSDIWVNNFSAVRNAAGEPVVDFTWESNGSDFAIYKAEIDTQSSDPTWAPTTPNTSITVLSDWVKVTITPEKIKSDEIIGNGTKWRAQETGLDSVEGKYLYAIEVDDGADNDFDYETDWAVPLTNSFKAEVASYGNDEVVLLTWDDTGIGATYKLERAAIKNIVNAGLPSFDFELDGDWVPITPSTLYYINDAPSSATPGNSSPRRAVVEDKPTLDKEYIYRLTITKSNVTDYEFDYIIASGPNFPKPPVTFTGFTDITFLGTGNQYNTNQASNSITLKLELDGPGNVAQDYPITLWRRVNNTTNTNESAFATVGTGLKFENGKNTWTITDTLPDNRAYTYLLTINGQWYLIDGVYALGYYESLISYNSGQYNGTNAPVDISASSATTAPKLPAWSRIIASGTVTTGATVANGTPDSWTGPNILGLKSGIKYTAKTGTPAADKDDIEGSVEVFVVTATITPAAPNTAGDPVVVEYYYYITLPLSATTTPDGPGTAKIGDDFWFNY